MNAATPTQQHETPSRWPHAIAVLLVCATFPLIWVGGLVTTYDAGMAVPDWPSTYGYNLFLYPLSTWLSSPWDLFIEHGHRLLASAVGLITIGLVVVTWRSESRSWVKFYMLGCLALVVGQGALGGLRVLLDETRMARIHGCIGPLFFSASVAAAAITSNWWNVGQRIPASRVSLSFVRLAWITTAIAYVQLVLGAHLRHVPATWTPPVFRTIVLAHLLTAAVLTLHVVTLTWYCVFRPQIREHRLLVRPAQAISCLLLLQLIVGAGTWRLKYQWPASLPQPEWLARYTSTAESMLTSVVVTAHVALGSLIVATGVLLALRSSRLFCALGSPTPLTVVRRQAGVLV